MVSNPIKEAIVKQSTSNKLASIAKEEGMDTLFQDGLKKVNQGITSVKEVMRVANIE